MNAPDRIWIIKDGDRNFGGHKIPLVSDRDIWANDPNAVEYIHRDHAVIARMLFQSTSATIAKIKGNDK